jgi:DNA-binding XRE family transcriptional regulator
MSKEKLLREAELATLAKKYRQAAGKNRAAAGRELGVSRVSIHRAEENPDESLIKLRARIIELYSPFKVIGPVFLLERK